MVGLKGQGRAAEKYIAGWLQLYKDDTKVGNYSKGYVLVHNFNPYFPSLISNLCSPIFFISKHQISLQARHSFILFFFVCNVFPRFSTFLLTPTQETPQRCPGPPPPPPPCPPCRAPSSRSPPTPSPWGRPPRRRRTPAGVGSRTINQSCGKIRAGSLKYNWVGNFVKLKQPSSLPTAEDLTLGNSP